MVTEILTTEAVNKPVDHEAPFRIEVVYNGTAKHFEVAIHELVSTVLAEALRAFHVTQQPHVMSLFNAEGTELTDSATVEQNHIERKAVLYLRQSKVKGGAS